MKRAVPEKYYNVIGPQIRKIRTERRLTQNDLAIKLQRAGWDLPRGTLAKIEARIQFVHEFELYFLAEALEVSLLDLLPNKPSGEPAHDFVTRRMSRRF